MALYRGTTTDHGDTLGLTIETRRRLPIDAKTPDAFTHPEKWQWLAVADHTLPRPDKTPSDLLLWARHQLHTLGWKVTGLNGRSTDDLTLALEPVDFEAIVAAATSRRTAAQTRAQHADLAWRTVIGDVPARGEDGYVSKARLGEITDHTRVYIDDIWKAQRARGQN